MPEAQAAPPSLNLFCITCGYNQRGILADHCPECGQDFSTIPPSPTRLPWLHRRYLGRVRAYCRTVAMVIFQKNIFCQQIEAAVPIRDAKRFWLLTIFLAWLAIVGAWLLPILTVPRLSPWREVREMLVYSVLVPIPISAFVVIGLLLFFAAATGMPSYFCHPRSIPIEQQNRAIALSYFASAPIAMTPLLILILILAAIARYRLPPLQLFFSGAQVLLLAVLTLWYTRTVGIVLTLSRRPRRNVTALLITLSWFAALLLCVVVIPPILFYTAALIYSMF